MYSWQPSGRSHRSAVPACRKNWKQLAEDPDMDEETLELIDSATENLEFNNSLVNFNLLDIAPEEDEDEEV